MEPEHPTRVLIVTDHAAATPDLLAAMRERAATDDVQFRLLVPNPAAAEVHLRHPERHEKAAEAELLLMASLSEFEDAAGGRVIGSVSIRHDPYDAIEETMLSEPIDEIILSVAPHPLARRLHLDLPHRLAHYAIPITTISG